MVQHSVDVLCFSTWPSGHLPRIVVIEESLEPEFFVWKRNLTRTLTICRTRFIAIGFKIEHDDALLASQVRRNVRSINPCPHHDGSHPLFGFAFLYTIPEIVYWHHTQTPEHNDRTLLNTQTASSHDYSTLQPWPEAHSTHAYTYFANALWILSQPTNFSLVPDSKQRHLYMTNYQYKKEHNEATQHTVCFKRWLFNAYALQSKLELLYSSGYWQRGTCTERTRTTYARHRQRASLMEIVRHARTVCNPRHISITEALLRRDHRSILDLDLDKDL